ncbi:hypothetical protein MARPU_09550 [Marichromatium purpuratum 984]|uniref:Peptidase U35 n=2 Tax=Marichromatium purpuratum TaxID=37487 RepID=W0E3R9_MARPU|nr:hypothetical protein MARPU_09550 [Marichromatium purpuratum 984]
MTRLKPADLIGKQSSREARIDLGLGLRAIDEDARTVEISFSSEAPVERWWGREILDHSPEAVRLERLLDGAPLLLDHDTSQQVGVIESARIDSDRIGRAQVRFSRSAKGEEVFQDVRDGIRTKASVGYLIHELVLEHSSDEDGDTYRITDWEPLEASLVSIPADPAVGVGRSLSPSPERPMDKEPEAPVAEHQETREAAPVVAESEAIPACAAPINPDAEQIRAVGAHFRARELAEDHIMLGGTLAEFRAQMRARTEKPDPVPSVARVESRVPHTGQLRAYRPELFHGGRREAEETAYRAGQWCLATMFGRADAARWCRDYGVQLNERVLTGLGAGQSVVIPDELVLPIISLREQYGLARRLCTVHSMTTDTASVPRDIGDVSAYFVGREQAPSVTDPAFDNVTLVAKNVAAETRISNDYADDSAINLAEFVAEKHARAFAIKEDECLINGNGSSTYGGIVGLRTAILELAGAVDAASGHDTFAAIDASDLRALMAKLPDLPGLQPVWLTSKPGQNLLFGRLTDAAGGNTKRELSVKMPDQWAGYDILTSPAMPKVATDLSNVAMVLFGDFRMGVIFGDRRGMTMMVDPYSLSSYQQTKIISSERFDINCHGVGDATNAGPIVALIGE